jgi:hypothetical protein
MFKDQTIKKTIKLKNILVIRNFLKNVLRKYNKYAKTIKNLPAIK